MSALRTALQYVEAGPCHARDVSELSEELLTLARTLVSMGLLRTLPARGRWARRVVVTANGSHSLGTFDSSKDLYQERRRRAA